MGAKAPSIGTIMATKYAEVTYLNTTGESEFSITFEYLEQSHVTVTLDGDTQINGTDYTINESTSKVVFGSGTSANEEVVISRTTPVATADLAVTFADGSGLSADDLNDSTKQNIFSIQEMKDEIAESILVVDTAMLGGNNLSDVDNVSTSRTNLDVYSTTETDALFADATGALMQSNNLSDVDSAATSRTNLDVYSKSEVYTKSETDSKAFFTNVTEYGATGDGVTDDTAAINSAIAASNKLYFPAGTYLISTALAISGGTPFHITGDGNSSIIQQTTNINILDISAGRNIIENIQLAGNSTLASNTSGAAMAFTSGSALTRVHNVRIANVYTGISLIGAPLITFNELDIVGFVYHGISMTGGSNYDSYIDNSIISGQASGPVVYGAVGIYMSDMCDEMIVRNTIINYCVNGLQTTSTTFSGSQMPEFCRFIACSFDSNTQGLAIDNSSDFVFDSCFISNRGNGGTVGTTNSRGVVFNNCNFLNNDAYGLVIQGNAVNTVIDNCKFLNNSASSSNTYHGLIFGDGCSDFYVTNCYIGNDEPGFAGSQGYGIVVNGTSHTRYTIADNTFTSNGTGAMLDATAGTHTRNISNNYGLVTFNKGQATFSAATSNVVTHGLFYTPNPEEINLNLYGADMAIRYYVSAITSTTFTITLTGSSTGTIVWSADARFR